MSQSGGWSTALRADGASAAGEAIAGPHRQHAAVLVGRCATPALARRRSSRSARDFGASWCDRAVVSRCSGSPTLAATARSRSSAPTGVGRYRTRRPRIRGESRRHLPDRSRRQGRGQRRLGRARVPRDVRGRRRGKAVGGTAGAGRSRKDRARAGSRKSSSDEVAPDGSSRCCSASHCCDADPGWLMVSSSWKVRPRHLSGVRPSMTSRARSCAELHTTLDRSNCPPRAHTQLRRGEVAAG